MTDTQTPAIGRRFDIGGRAALLELDNGSLAFQHVCASNGDSAIRGALNVLDLTGHTATDFDGIGSPTVDEAIHCPDCGMHGTVTDGVWRAATS